MTYILGLNSAYHESSVCLIKDGEIVAIAEEERFNRKKHGKSARTDNPDELPVKALNYCLEKAGITLTDVHYVGYSLNPKVRLQKNANHKHPYKVTSEDFGTKEGEELFYQKNLEVENKVKELGFSGRFLYLNHHDCHAASSYIVSEFKEAAVMVVDGIGEFESTTLYKGTGNKLEKIQSLEFPNSLGFLWEKLSKYLGFSEYDACKVMGLASYGDSKVFQDRIRKLIDVKENGTFTIDDTIIQFRNEDYSGLESLFGLDKRSEPVRKVGKRTQDYADLAAALQEVTEEVVIKLARTIKDETGAKNLCLSGGVALNCVANGKLLEERIFEDVFVQPAANDAGTALGAAFYIWNQVLNKPRESIFDSACLSAEFSDEEIKNTLDEGSLSYELVEDVTKKAAQLLAEGNVVSWFQGAMEVGPRALGNRSILCDPRKKDAVALLNHKVKHREAFRPFCPSVLVDKASEWFDLNGTIPSPAKYMLSAFNVLDYRKGIIPAVTHVDGTARIQAVQKDTKYYRLIEEFEKLTGVPVVLNTSFNDQEPIVCNPEDAVKTFLKTRIDYLVIGNFIVSRGEQNE
ncbi:MAG: carbamoyltransferase C-terminal domain-containing protein [Candidatus Nanoarchaeia archaeon]|nr:carbamoyltransferase C-terminal domain-containing protein [Candidatus Nanoarchaeia archaeon]|tara:strand:- start:1047 stop:2771 length:1725 start_codon:yes stop_codon:yes gene_type:complete